MIGTFIAQKFLKGTIQLGHCQVSGLLNSIRSRRNAKGCWCFLESRGFVAVEPI